MGIKIKNLPQKCEECQCMQSYADYYICGIPETNPDKLQLDISTYKVKPDTKPEWCLLDKVNASLVNLNEEQELAIKGMTALFGAQNAFEDDDKRELARIVRCNDCRHRYNNDHKCPFCNECGAKEYPGDDWFCADGETMA